MGDDRRAEVTFRQSARDYVEHALAEFDTPEAQGALFARRRSLNLTIGSILIGGACLGLVIAYMLGFIDPSLAGLSTLPLGAVIGAALTSPVVLPHFAELRRQRTARVDAARQILSVPSLTLESEIKVTLDSEGVALRDRFAASGWLWPAIESIQPVRGGIAIATRNRRLIIIPNRAFPVPAEAERFLELGEKYVREAKNGEAMIAAFLEDHDLPCPECGRELKGCGKSACPNCGAEITLDDVREYLSWKLTGSRAA